MKIVLVLLLLLTFSVPAEDKAEEFVDFSTVKDLLKNDKLDKIAQKRQKAMEEKRRAKLDQIKRQYQYPERDEFLKLLTELWVVKRAKRLKWNFKKADLGIGPYFKNFLENMGYVNEDFNLLIVNTPIIPHMGLPMGNKNSLYIVSLPFIRTLDLTKLEVSLLLLENRIRLDEKLFEKKLEISKEHEKLFGSNFYKKKIDKSVIDHYITRYDDQVFTKGYTFNEQFTVTKKMEQLLKDDLRVWGIYLKLIEKIDELVKGNLLYKDYLRIYPSPEMQLTWLKKKND